MIIRIFLISNKRTQFFFDRCRFFSSFRLGEPFKRVQKNGRSFFDLYPFPNSFRWKGKFIKFDAFPYWFTFFNRAIIGRVHRRNVFYSLRAFVNDDFFLRNKFFEKKVLHMGLSELSKLRKRACFHIGFAFFYYYSRKRKKKKEERNFFFFRDYKIRQRASIFKYLVLYNKDISNFCYTSLRIRPRAFFIFCNIGVLFIKSLYFCLKGLRLFFFDFDFILFLNKLFFFSSTRSFIFFFFIRKLFMFINRFVHIFYVCSKFNVLFFFLNYYKIFKYKMFNFFFLIKDKMFLHIYFFFSKLICFFFLSTNLSLSFNLNVFLSSLYVFKEKLFLQKSYIFLFGKLLKKKLKTLMNKRTSFFFIRSTTYNTYFTFLFNGRILYKKSAGMFEVNRKSRLEYDVIKKMSNDFKSNFELFLIKFPIKKLHLILSGFKRIQRYVVTGLSIFRSFKKRKYVGAYHAYVRAVRSLHRLVPYFNFRRVSVLFGLSKSSFKRLRFFRLLKREFRKVMFFFRRALSEISRHKRFLFIQDFAFVVSHQPFNGCRGRRLITKRK
jgi:hypothetical protein